MNAVFVQLRFNEWEPIASFVQLADGLPILPALARTMGAPVRIQAGGELPQTGIPRGVTLMMQGYTDDPTKHFYVAKP